MRCSRKKPHHQVRRCRDHTKNKIKGMDQAHIPNQRAKPSGDCRDFPTGRSIDSRPSVRAVDLAVTQTTSSHHRIFLVKACSMFRIAQDIPESGIIRGTWFASSLQVSFGTWGSAFSSPQSTKLVLPLQIHKSLEFDRPSIVLPYPSEIFAPLHAEKKSTDSRSFSNLTRFSPLSST